MDIEKLKKRLEKYFSYVDKKLKAESNIIKKDLKLFLNYLNNGKIRVAEKKGGDYIVNAWIKKAILLIFKLCKVKTVNAGGQSYFYDKELIIPDGKRFAGKNIRLVPNASCVRFGAYIGKNCVLMSPCYVNIGAYVDEGTLLDSNALIGSCAQIGKKVHISAGAQIGGVLEPVGALPVIIEDGVLVGGNCGIYEGVIVEKDAVIAAGVILTSGTVVYDLAKKTSYRAAIGAPLRIPTGAVVVPGSRKINDKFALEKNLHIYTPIIIKYKDEKTRKKVKIEEDLR